MTPEDEQHLFAGLEGMADVVDTLMRSDAALTNMTGTLERTIEIVGKRVDDLHERVLRLERAQQ